MPADLGVAVPGGGALLEVGAPQDGVLAVLFLDGQHDLLLLALLLPDGLLWNHESMEQNEHTVKSP